MELITENLKVIILALIAGIAGIAITMKIKRKNTNKVNQKRNNVRGDMAGRDINK